MNAKKKSDLQSMTGFARVDGNLEDETASYTWTWEIRSLNSKGLDLKTRLPSWLENLEPEIRKYLKDHISRGSINANLQLRSEASEQNIQVNEQALSQVTEAISVVRKKIPDAVAPSIDGILGLRGVLAIEDLELSDEKKKALAESLQQSFAATVEQLVAARSAEGKKIKSVLKSQLSEMHELTETAKLSASAVPSSLKQRLEKQVQELISQNLPEDRLAQEVALLAVKADIREELDRLEAHIASAQGLLEEGASVGRRLDFLTQEFNREANTLCSKAQTIDLKNVGLALKTVVDQMREQVQNIE